jgi:hypothetical protein
MALREQLISFGFVGGECRLDNLLNFLQTQEIERLEDLFGCPTLVGIAGADAIQDHDLLFVQKVGLPCDCACKCVYRQCELGGCFTGSEGVACGM